MFISVILEYLSKGRYTPTGYATLTHGCRDDGHVLRGGD